MFYFDEIFYNRKIKMFSRHHILEIFSRFYLEKILKFVEGEEV